MQHLIPQTDANGLGNKLANANQQLVKQTHNNSKTNNNTQHITYSPSIVIQGNADKSQVQQAMKAGQSNFDEIMRNKYRLSY
jgi:Tfp pilus assembly protein FimT